MLLGVLRRIAAVIPADHVHVDAALERRTSHRRAPAVQRLAGIFCARACRQVVGEPMTRAPESFAQVAGIERVIEMAVAGEQ